MILLINGTRTAVRPPMWLASASVAKKVIQSPHEEAALAHHSREKGPLRSSSITTPKPIKPDSSCPRHTELKRPCQA